MFDERDVSFVYGEGMCYTQHTTVCDIHTANYVWLCAVIFAALFASSNFQLPGENGSQNQLSSFCMLAKTGERADCCLRDNRIYSHVKVLNMGRIFPSSAHCRVRVWSTPWR